MTADVATTTPTPATGDTDADVLVIFGITGDLAKVMTFRSLYRLEKRGLLDLPIVGVAFEDWTLDQLVERAKESIVGTGETLDDDVFGRLAARFSYVQGDFDDDATYERVRNAISDRNDPVFYLEIPPSLFGRVVKGLAGVGLTKTGRVVVEKPFGHDLASARALAAELHQYVDESRLYRIDHYLGKMGLEEILFLRFGNTMFEPIWNRNYIRCVQITMVESFGVEDRGSFYDPVGALRDVVVNHLLQLLAAAAMESPSRGDPETLRSAATTVLSAVAQGDPKHYVRGQYDGYLSTKGVADDSTTETYAALRLDIENWRWAGVPFFIRTGKHLAETQTELRIVFEESPQLGFGLRQPGGEPDQLVIRLDPTAGLRVIVQAKQPDADSPEVFTLDRPFADPGEEAPTPYEVLLVAAMQGQTARFARQDTVEEQWRIVAPLLDNPPAVETYKPGSWGPTSADALVDDDGGWRGPWSS